MCDRPKIRIFLMLKENSYLISVLREEKEVIMPLIEYYGLLFEWHDQKWI